MTYIHSFIKIRITWDFSGGSGKEHLPVQETWVRSLIQEDPTYHGATKLVHHDY